MKSERLQSGCCTDTQSSVGLKSGDERGAEGDPLRTFLAHARLETYIAEHAQKLRSEDYRVLCASDEKQGLMYIDSYYASSDDTILRGIELVIQFGSHRLLRIDYEGGFRPLEGLHTTSRSVLDRILKPCRRIALTQGHADLEGSLDDIPYRYVWCRSHLQERETISMNILDSWVTVHEILFVEARSLEGAST